MKTEMASLSNPMQFRKNEQLIIVTSVCPYKLSIPNRFTHKEIRSRKIRDGNHEILVQ